ncbi:MAG TPA: hypothetical protein VKD72_18815, partial [Gemmataceae bacterium]|nr:hypothetical protein [Gemmataceae bacterium]
MKPVFCEQSREHSTRGPAPGYAGAEARSLNRGPVALREIVMARQRGTVGAGVLLGLLVLAG